MYDSFKDPNFDVDDWINKNIDYKESENVKHYEDAANQLLIRLQMNSRDISQTTDQNIRGLVDALPQAMAKLKHISDSVNDLSSSLRLLTNSGYKFKSDNAAPDKISELSNLKIKRDRLKDASDKLQHGIDIETDLQQLQASAAIGDLKSVCERYKNVSIASESLSSISKFDSIKNSLSSIQKTLGNRINPELNSACLRMNSDTFSRYTLYSQQIGLKDLPLDSIFKTFRQQIDKERVSYDCDPPLPITDWLPMCLKKCNDYLSNFSKWTVSLTTIKAEENSRLSFRNKSLSLNPVLPIDSKIITDELLRIFEDVISPSIDSHAKTFLTTSKFDDLATIVGMIRDFTTNIIHNNNIFKGNITRIQNQFPEALKIFLNSSLPKSTIQNHQTLPKSSTSGNLSKQQQFPSPSRSTEFLTSKNTKSSNIISTSDKSDNETALKSDTYDPKMLEICTAISSRALEWIKVLARDPTNCIDFIGNYMNQVINIFTFELQYHLEEESHNASSSKPPPSGLPLPTQKNTNSSSDDNNRQTMFISNLLVLYMNQVSQEKKLKTFEINARTIKNDFSSPSIQCVKDVIEHKILSVMSMKSLQLLNGLHNEKGWNASNTGQNDLADSEFSSFSNIALDQSLYVKEISNSIMQMLQTLTQGSALSSDMIRKWTTKTAETVVTAYAKEIAAIPKLSKSGQEQLKTDIDYLLNLLSVMELDGGKDLPGILAVLNADEKERKNVLSKSDMSPDIARGIQTSLSIA